MKLRTYEPYLRTCPMPAAAAVSCQIPPFRSKTHAAYRRSGVSYHMPSHVWQLLDTSARFRGIGSIITVKCVRYKMGARGVVRLVVGSGCGGRMCISPQSLRASARKMKRGRRGPTPWESHPLDYQLVAVANGRDKRVKVFGLFRWWLSRHYGTWCGANAILYAHLCKVVCRQNL